MRIATIPFQQTLANGIQQAQSKLADTQLALNSGKKAQDLAGLGSLAVATLSARSLLSKQDAQGASAKQLGITLSLYDANISSIDDNGIDLHQQLLTALGTGQASGLQGTIEGAFSQFRSALNATDGSGALFGGSQTDAPPFKLQTLADAVGATPASAFGNDDVHASARVGDGVDVTYGVTASEIGGNLLSVFRTLAEAGPIGTTLTSAQSDALKTALTQLDAALPQLRNVNATNGERQKQVETLQTRAEDRANLLSDYVSSNEDADPGQLAIDLAQQKTILQASYSVFSQVSGLSLVNYLK